jgi:L-seryl-tRNA(Ser) seleniumtransferase
MPLRNLPSVDALLQSGAVLIETYGRPLVVQAIRATLNTLREQIQAGAEVPPNQAILAFAADRLAGWTKPTLEPVINATGVILHTNLGRAPLSQAAIAAMQMVSQGYSNLEYDLATGKRGSRLLHAEALLQQLTGAEAAVIVNNCASAVLLTLSALASRKSVILARSQLVEIGGGFRIPDVMKQSGAELVEIGTTNKIRLEDYEQALLGFSTPATQPILMRVHRSNFKLTGFTSEPEPAEIAGLAHRQGTLLIDDLGSGTLIDVTPYGLSYEPTVQASLAAGADILLFSGDKLLGGPQAGIILGRAELLGKIKRHPLARALRADKLCLAALNATLLHYLKDEAVREIPIWRMISQTSGNLRDRAEAWQREIGCGEVVSAESTVGGGSLPGESLPTFVLSLAVQSPDAFLARLRGLAVPVVARAADGRVLLDPRTVLPGQDGQLVQALKFLLL